MTDNSQIREIVNRLFQYLKNNNFKGWDVHDGLNSRIFQKLPFNRNKMFRLLWLQFFRNSPVNLRSLLKVSQGYNPKALALFISGLIHLYHYYHDYVYYEIAVELGNKLFDLKSSGYSGLGWGYNFPWQSRAFYVPAYKPNMICSVFAGQALFDLYKITKDYFYLDQVEQIAQFITSELIIKEDDRTLCLGYVPGEKAVVHNVNLIGAAFFARLFHLTGHLYYREMATKSVRFSIDTQRDDGAWVYGGNHHHQWVDNFHTGYNLVSIYYYQRYCNDTQFESALITGINYHLNHHFTEQALSKYSDHHLYPLDIHCFAQAIITFITLQDYVSDYKKRVDAVIDQAIKLFWDREHHYFWYQKNRFYTIKIPYIRWAQAWMFYALSYYLVSELD